MRPFYMVLISLPFLLASCNPFEAKIVTACEEGLKSRLRSPSEYKRVEITRSESVFTERADFYNHLYKTVDSSIMREASMRLFDGGQLKPTLFTLVISYDAPNAYGTPIRDVSICEFFEDHGDDSKANDLFVKIDGKSHTDWLIDRLRASQ